MAILLTHVFCDPFIQFMPTQTKICLYQNQQHPCDYLASEVASNQSIDPLLAPSTPLYSQLAAHGFRRSGSHIYRPNCPDCSACIATRLPVEQFKPNRNQRRILKKNNDIKISIQPARYGDEYYELYIRYQQSRHTGGTMANSSQDDFINFLTANECETTFVEYRISKKLVAVAVTDQLEEAHSAVYTFFDPTLTNRSLGGLTILNQIKEANDQKKRWLYLGFWIEHCRKMSYKIRFKPLEGFNGSIWQPLKFDMPSQ